MATLRLRGNWWKLLAVWTYLYPQEVTLLLHLVALLLLTALLLLAALLEALPPLLLPHTAPLLQHSSPTPLLPCITRHRRLVFGCFVVRQPPPSSAGAIELARVRGAEAWLQLAARGAWWGECAKIWNRRTDSGCAGPEIRGNWRQKGRPVAPGYNKNRVQWWPLGCPLESLSTNGGP